MPERAADLVPENISTLDRLVRSIDLAEGFALFFARCNVPVLRDELMLTATQKLAALGVEVVEVAFEDEPVNVRERLRAALTAAGENTEAPIPVELPAPVQPLAVAEPPSGYTVGAKRAVFVTGLEYGIPYDQPNARILAELNLGRDAFPRDVPYPLVIWLPDYAVTAVARFAPDFWAWRSGVFEFETGEAGRSLAFERYRRGDQSWDVLNNLAPEARLLRRRQLESLLDDYRDLSNEPRVAMERAAIVAILGDLCATSQDFDDAIVYYQQALQIIHRSGDSADGATILNNLGLVHGALGNKQKALDYFEQSLALSRHETDRMGEASTLSNLGTVHADLGEQRVALDYFEQALALSREVDDQAGEATILNNIGWAYYALGEQQVALDYFEQALTRLRQVGNRAVEAATMHNLGLVFFALGDNRKALDYYQQALSISRQLGNRTGEAVTRLAIGKVYDTLGDKRKALDFYKQAVDTVHLLGDRWHESTGRFNIAKIYEELGDWAKAEEQLTIVVALDEAVSHPNLAGHRAALERIQAKRAEHEATK
jgi:tetratricopeptide (TPR) repeat protein